MKLIIPEWNNNIFRKMFPPIYPNIKTPEQSSEDHLRLNDVLSPGIYVKHPFSIMTMAGDQMGRFVQGRGLMSQALAKGYTVILLRHIDVLYCALKSAEKHARDYKINIRVNENTTLKKSALNVFLNIPDKDKDNANPNITPGAFKELLSKIYHDPASVGIDTDDKVLVIIESHPWASSKEYCYIQDGPTANCNISTLVLASHPNQLDKGHVFDICIFMKNIDLEIDPDNHQYNKCHVINTNKHPVIDLKIGDSYIISGDHVLRQKLYYEGPDAKWPWDKKK